MVVEEGDDAGVGDFFFLLDGEEVVDGAAGVGEVVLCECSPEEVDGVAGFFVGVVAVVFEGVPVPVSDEADHHGFSHFDLLQSGFGHPF